VRIVSTGAGGHGCHACRHPDRARDLPRCDLTLPTSQPSQPV